MSATTRFADAWAAAVGLDGHFASGRTDAVRALRALAAEFVAALRNPTPDLIAARELGARLTAAPVAGPHVLSASLGALRSGVGDLLGEPPPAEALDAVLAEFADGYAEGLRERTRSEQESLIEAVLKTRDEAEAALRASEERFRTVFTQAGVGIGIADLNAELTEVNPALVAMFGSKGLLIEPRPITDQAHPEDAPAFSQLFGELARGERESFRSETRFVRPDSTVLWTHLTASLVRDEQGEPAYVVGVLEDVTERHQLRTRLRHQTYHDQLTRLPNRSLMDEQLYWAFSEGSPITRVGLCHLDLDGFRRINDSLGHQVGDQLLLAVAGRLHLAAGQHLITRTGGDEFAILVTDPPDTGFLCALADKVLAGLAPPFVIGSQRLSITASMGIAEDAVANTWAGELQRAADAARTWAKDAGGGRWAVFDAERDAGETSRFALAASVPGAVDRDEFDVFYQPLVDLGSGGLVGVEALVRWRHPEHGLLGPARFIDLAERNGAIVPLGRWVLEAACRQARAWADALGSGGPYVSVNVAPRQLAEPGWLAQVSSVLAESGLDPGQLQLEITERAVLVDEPAASNTLRALRDMGVRLAVDDFGTGYSSLSYLRRLPVHGLKIDGSFIRGLRGPLVCDSGPAAAECAESADGKIVEALISMAHALDLVVTAEWVETAEQAHRLVALGCDVGQGHWYGDPMPARQLDPLLRRPLAG